MARRTSLWRPRFDSPSRCASRSVADGFAHLTTGSTGSILSASVRAIDVRVPGVPKREETDLGAYVALAHTGDRLYAAGADRFEVVDVEVPLAPVRAGSLGLPSSSERDVEISGDTRLAR